jgi:RimJ/RimL family protein N-acetyltransferase
MRNPLIVGERLYLRPLETSDAEEIAWQAASESEVFMDRWRVPFSPIGGEQWISELYKQQPPDTISLAVCLKQDDTLIGNMDLIDIDWVHRTAETGAWINLPEYRGKGYGTEAKHLILEYAFDHLHLHAIRSYVWAPNTRSAAALAKQGYRPAGRLKWEDVQHGVLRDALLFDLLREDWLAARGDR